MKLGELKGFLISVALLFISLCAFSKAYYFVSNFGSDKKTGSQQEPWKTLKRINSIKLKPGDSVIFARGANFKGGFIINTSGTSYKPITFCCYGAGAAPMFQNINYSDINGNVINVQGSYIIIDGLHFLNTANYTKRITNELNKKAEDKNVLLIGAVYQGTGAHHLIVKNCEFYDCPIAVYINGKYNLITKNYFHDCNRFLCEPGWGPIAIFVGNANNEISYNKCINYKKEGGNFGADGGFIEFDSRYYGGPIHDVYIHHNYSEGNEGFLEITNSGKHLNISYNVSDDFQQFVFFWAGDSSRVENNTVIRTKPANSKVNVVFTFKNSGYIIRNNIFVMANGLKVFAGGAYDARNFNQLHENNIYYMSDHSTADPVGQSLGKGEMIKRPFFVDFKNNDFHLLPNSPAIDCGQNLGYNQDFDNHPVPFGKKVDIGAFEFNKNIRISKSAKK